MARLFLAFCLLVIVSIPTLDLMLTWWETGSKLVPLSLTEVLTTAAAAAGLAVLAFFLLKSLLGIRDMLEYCLHCGVVIGFATFVAVSFLESLSVGGLSIFVYLSVFLWLWASRM
jgi:hypothetical protein